MGNELIETLGLLEWLARNAFVARYEIAQTGGTYKVSLYGGPANCLVWSGEGGCAKVALEEAVANRKEYFTRG